MSIEVDNKNEIYYESRAEVCCFVVLFGNTGKWGKSESEARNLMVRINHYEVFICLLVPNTGPKYL